MDRNPFVKRREEEKLICPICGNEVGYLVGDDTPEGGKRGCEACWKPSPKGGGHESRTEEAGYGADASDPKKIVFD